MKNKVKTIFILGFLAIFFLSCDNPFWPKHDRPDDEYTRPRGPGVGGGGSWGGGGWGGSGNGGGINYYQVRFNSNGGSPAPEDQRILPGGNIMRVAPPSRGSDGFGGWSLNGQLPAWDFSRPVNSDLTLIAIWGSPSSSHTVTFVNVGGIDPVPQEIMHLAKITVPDAITRADFAFGGWWTTIGGGLPDGSNWDVPWDFAWDLENDITLYAMWVPTDPAQYQVTFFADNGIPNPAPQRLTSGTPVTEPIIYRDSHAFGGWYTDPSFNTRWDFATGVTGNLTLYAQWEIRKYPITFQANGGTPVPATQIVDYGGRVTRPPPPVIPGSILADWYYDQNLVYNWDFINDIVVGSFTLYAGYINEYRVVQYILANDDPEDLGFVLVFRGTIITDPLIPGRRENYAFRYWYNFDQWYAQDNSLTPPPPVFDFANTPINDSITLRGWWENINTRDVEFWSLPGGDLGGGDPLAETQTVFTGSTARVPDIIPVNPVPAPPSRFAGWYRDSDTDPFNFNTPINDNIILHPRWVAESVNPYVPGDNTSVEDAPAIPGLVWVPPGSFIMGDDRISGSGPSHRVNVSGFYMADVPVTQIEYVRVMANPLRNIYTPIPTAVETREFNPSNFRRDEGNIRRNYPVDRVSWYDAILYCIRKTAQHNEQYPSNTLTPVYTIADMVYSAPLSGTNNQLRSIISATVTEDKTANGYRLPTEAEWEYAARYDPSGNYYTFSGSNNASLVAVFNTNSGGMTNPVGSKAPNALGIYDMNGNISEWCWDWYGPYTRDEETDPWGPSGGTLKVRRGGAWSNTDLNVRSVVRSNFSPDNHTYVMGIRVVRGLAPNERPP